MLLCVQFKEAVFNLAQCYKSSGHVDLALETFEAGFKVYSVLYRKSGSYGTARFVLVRPVFGFPFGVFPA